MSSSKPNCLGCGTPIGEDRQKYCTKDCGRKHWRRLKAARARSTPRPCANPSCGNTVTADKRKRFCSEACYKLRTWDREVVLRRTAKNLETSPPCTICGNTTARSGFGKRNRPELLAMVPPGILLCKTHLKGYSGFISLNRYHGFDRDEVFTAYLVSKTFTGVHRASYLQMMRESFHAT